jgi:hypothetical protein
LGKQSINIHALAKTKALQDMNSEIPFHLAYPFLSNNLTIPE